MAMATNKMAMATKKQVFRGAHKEKETYIKEFL